MSVIGKRLESMSLQQSSTSLTVPTPFISLSLFSLKPIAHAPQSPRLSSVINASFEFKTHYLHTARIPPNTNNHRSPILHHSQASNTTRCTQTIPIPWESAKATKMGLSRHPAETEKKIYYTTPNSPLYAYDMY